MGGQHARPGGGQPGAGQPGHAKPGAGQHGAGQPGAVTAASRSPVSAPAGAQPVAGRPTVTRAPSPNLAAATRKPHAQAAHAGARDHKRDKAAAQHDRVARSHAQARHQHTTRHRRTAHARFAHRAYRARHHHHHHHWSWWYRPWWPHAYYGPWYHPRWAYGVFVYGPYPHHVVYVDGQPDPEPEGPTRQVDRLHTWAIGARGGSYISGYQAGPSFGDFGMGLAVRYRAAEALGFELAWTHHDQTWTEDTERWSEPFAASVQLFALPWTRFNPYVSAGVTWTDRSYRDSWIDHRGSHTVSEDHVIFGPHGGLGLEFGIGDSASINLEGRLVGYLNIREEDAALPSAVQTTAGVNFYF